ncbi:MAG: helix-turn-helix transcriptional regulator [Gammaproteobacteria bacterium]|nr:helix-turn-helix transcriptional regulator [Gammaproteobacteria bacterium]
MALHQKWVSLMTSQDKQFYRELGQRIANLRKAQSLTQVQLAEHLGIAQQTMAHYEGGTLRIAVALLKSLAQVLQVSVEQLVDEKMPAKSKRGPTSKLQRQVEQVRLMPRTKQKFISDMLEALITQQQSA